MIIQFSPKNCLNLEIAKFLYGAFDFSKGELDYYIENINELSRHFSLSSENQQINPLLFQLINELRNGKIKTPHDDINLVPFILNDDETPVTSLNAWLRQVSLGHSPKTTTTYAYAIFDFFQFLEAKNVNWMKVTDDILATYRIVQESTFSAHKNSKNGKQKISKNTIQQRLMCVTLFYKFAVANKFLKEIPFTLESISYSVHIQGTFLGHLGSRRIKEIPIVAYRHNQAKKPIKFQTPENIKKWIESIKNERDRLIAMILYRTGMRREEIISWKIENIPSRESCQISNQCNTVELEITGKGGSPRTIYLTAPLFLRLWDYINLIRSHIIEKYKKNVPDHGYVWVTLNSGNPLQAVSLDQIFSEISERVGIKITPHTLRHSFAMQKRIELYEDGRKNPEKILKEMLGHKNITTTMDVYGHVSPQELAEESVRNSRLIQELIKE